MKREVTFIASTDQLQKGFLNFNTRLFLTREEMFDVYFRKDFIYYVF